jgi:fumarate hydratase subunit beta
MPTIIRTQRLRAVGGKGGLSQDSLRAMQEVGCVYLSFLGGGAALHTSAIEGVVNVAWNDLVPHYRLVKLRVSGLGPLTVGIDAHGNSIYDELHRAAAGKRAAILQALDQARRLS